MDQTAGTIAGDTSNTFQQDLCIETYALLDSGSDKTQITQKVADALHVQQPKDITLPLASVHGEHSVKLSYGVKTLLGWTLTGPIPQRYTQKRVGQSNNTSITLFNHIRRRRHDPDEDLLQFFWTNEGVNFNQFSSKGQYSDDKEALSILNYTIKHIGDRYQIGLPWKKDITLPNNYLTTSWPKFSGTFCSRHWRGTQI